MANTAHQRSTRQRKVILDILRGTRSHPTAEYIHTRARKTLPHLSLGTVYRNLDMLAKNGDIIKLEIPGGRNRFDAFTEDHHHVMCTKCGAVGDLDRVETKNIDRLVKNKKNNFKITGYRIEFLGLCPKCKGKG